MRGLLSLPLLGTNPAAVARDRLTREASALRDTVRAAPVPIPVAAAAASVLTLIMHIAGTERR